MTSASTAQLPGGATLAPGERIIAQDRFRLTALAFYLHTEMVLTNRRLYAFRPNTVIGLIPVGTSRSNFPIENVAGISASSRFDLLGMIFGILGFLVGLAALTIPNVGWIGVILAVLGLGAIVGAPKQAIAVTNSGGDKVTFPVSWLERGRPVAFCNVASEALVRTVQRAPSPSTAAFADPVSRDPTAALQRLGQLKDQGLVTDAEYTQKRNEILARL